MESWALIKQFLIVGDSSGKAVLLIVVVERLPGG
jgi:hypothetical protein